MRTETLQPFRAQVIDTAATRNPARTASSAFAAALRDAAPSYAARVVSTAASTGQASSGSSSRSTADIARVPGDRAVPPPAVTPQKSSIVDTPIGIFDLNSTDRRGFSVDASSELEASFMTHAPAEWYKDPLCRAAFAKLYGAAALAVLDATGKVPKNIDPMWVAPKSTTRTV